MPRPLGGHTDKPHMMRFARLREDSLTGCFRAI
jgi:hypothetical protein